MKPAKDLHLPVSVMPATPCLMKDNIYSLSLFCPNYYVITFSSRFGELPQKTQLSLLFTHWRHIQAWHEDYFGSFITLHSQSKLSKILSLLHEVHLVSFLVASQINLHLSRADKDTRVYRQMFSIFLTIHNRLPTQGQGSKASICFIHKTSLIKLWSGKRWTSKNHTLFQLKG